MKISDQLWFFDEALQKKIRDSFYYVDQDHNGRKRCFFENSGGSLRLKRAVEAKARFEGIPDCPERPRGISLDLKKVKENGIRDILEVIFGAEKGKGALVTELTASQCMFQIIRAILENVSFGTNAVTTSLEHPSAHDAVELYCRKTGREFRVVKADPATGGITAEDLVSKIDKNTVLLSVMSASNTTGYIFDLEEIVKKARAINPDIYIVSDAVQHMPHCNLYVGKLGLDGCNFAPYKAFGIRGCGFGYVSDRVAKLCHHKLLQKPEKEWELGTFPHANFAAVSAVVDYVCWIGSHFSDSDDRRERYLAGMEKIHLHEHSLLVYMLEGSEKTPGLRHIPGVHVYCDCADTVDKDLIAAIGIDGLDCSACAEAYYRNGITVCERSAESLYSKRILESLGLQGAIRVSPLHCHTTEDIDTFLRVTAELAERKNA